MDILSVIQNKLRLDKLNKKRELEENNWLELERNIHFEHPDCQLVSQSPLLTPTNESSTLNCLQVPPNLDFPEDDVVEI